MFNFHRSTSAQQFSLYRHRRSAAVLSLVAVFSLHAPQPVDAVAYVCLPAPVVVADGQQIPIRGQLPTIPDRPAKRVFKVITTAYTSHPAETDGSPDITASGSRTRPGVIAANFLPFGTLVRFPDAFGDRIFVVEDRMHPRFSNRADIWMPDRPSAFQWGARNVTMEVL